MNNWLVLVLLTLSLAGIYTCRLIMLHMFNKDSLLSAKLCGNKGVFNCNKVLQSPISSIFSNIHLQDIGLVYFITQVLYLICESLNDCHEECYALLRIPYTLAFLSTLVLLVYQAFVIKAWCKMCLIVSAVIWLQMSSIISYFLIGHEFYNDLFMRISLIGKSLTSLLMLIFCVSIASIWFSIKPILEIANDVKLTNAKMLLLKSNINVFMALLRRQRTIDASLWENDFLIGSKDAAVQLMVAINTYCPPCAREYKNLLEIVRTFPDSIGVTMRFFVDSNEDSKTTRSVLYVLSQYVSTSKEEQSKILENWFSSNPVSPEEKKVHQYTEQTGILKQYQEWFHKNNVTHTPTIFLNGYELPKPYYVLDLKMLIPKLSNRLIKLTNQKVNNGSPQDSSLKHS